MLVQVGFLTSETVKGASLTFKGIHHIHSGYRLPLGMLSVGDRVSDDIFKEDLENPTGFFIDETRNALHTTPSSQTANGRLGNSLDVITEYLAMPFCTSLS